VTSLASKARAQYTTAAAGPYTGGQVVGGSSVDPTSVDPTSASYGPVSGGYGANGGASGGYTTSCSGAITATFNWTGIAPAPQSAIVVETSSVFASADCYGYQAHGPPSAACADGMGDTATINTSYPPHNSQEVMSGSVSRTRYTNQGGQTITLTCSPSASAYTPNGTESHADVAYSAAVYPVIISPGGATSDGNGGYDILVGQHCAPTLSPPPPGCTYSNYQWSVTGTTFQTWSADTPAVGGNSYNPDASYYVGGPGPLNVATPSWYWNNMSSAGGGNSTTKTVSCAATVTPPAGQGSAFIVTATQPITVWNPIWNCTGIGGEVKVDTSDPVGNGTDYWLYAGPTPAELKPNFVTVDGVPIGRGMTWNAAVAAPSAPVAFGNGSLEVVQIIEELNEDYVTKIFGISNTHNDPLDNQEGLDTSWPYGWVQTTPDYLSGDSPDLCVSNPSSITSADMDITFEDYLMYAAPGSVQYVPLGYYVWTADGSATIPSTNNWANFANPAGTVTDSNEYKNYLPGNSFPMWTQIDTAVSY
jgi:hypothetical protein